MTESQLQWTDASGNRWSGFISLSDARRLKHSQSIDLLDPRSIEVLFGGDLFQRVEAIGELARPQWTEAGLTYEDFADRLFSGEETFLQATNVLRMGISDFFRRAGRGDLAVVADRAWNTMQAEANLRMARAKGEKVGEILNRSLAESEAALDRELDRVLETLGNQSGSSPESPGSIGNL